MDYLVQLNEARGRDHEHYWRQVALHVYDNRVRCIWGSNILIIYIYISIYIYILMALFYHIFDP